jgi:type I restriction enzyme R subunit
MPNFISEDQIEQALLQRLQHLHGYDVLDCYTALAEDLNDASGRTDKRDVILLDRLREAALRLNPAIPAAVIDSALARLADKRWAMSPIAANREVDGLIRDGIPVEFENAEGRQEQERVRVIDFNDPAGNRFLAVSQLWVRGEHYWRRSDVLLYVNGLPLVFIELKNSNVKLRAAYDDNLTNYKAGHSAAVPDQCVCLLSNAIETKVGSVSAGSGSISSTGCAWKTRRRRWTARRSATKAPAWNGRWPVCCAPARLLDYVRELSFYYKDTQKIIAQNHQFIGVNNAYRAFLQRGEKQGRLGVFWHTQGSGKSFSMIFYARKIFRKLRGNFTLWW